MKNLLLSALAILLISPALFAQKAGKYASLFSEEQLKDTVRFLSDDGFEGRAPGSRGGELAAKFIAYKLKSLGIKPGNEGSYFQPVSLVAVKADTEAKLRVSNRNASFDYDFGRDYVVTTGAQRRNVNVNAELVFVGYGIDAPEQDWNDYKGGRDDYEGKILVMLVNDPPPTRRDPERFGGKALTYYGRWTYKYEEAARRGAAGVILIHTDESAGYGWNVVETSMGGGWRFEVERGRGDNTPYLDMKSWVSEQTARRIFSQAGLNLNELMEDAADDDFKPVKTGLTVQLRQNYELQMVESNNVIGFWEGRDDRLKNEYVIYTSHWDHLGVGKPNADGDSIYNGALDNSSGVAQTLALAEAITKLRRDDQPKRSQVFLFTTAEEQGLLGAEWYSRNPVYPLTKTAANINIDGGNFYGITRDYGALGAERSEDLEDIVNDALKDRSMRFLPDNRPEQGYFFRSDHFPFAKAGVPALSIRSGADYAGRPAGWSEQFFAEYNSKHYHQPSDEFREDWTFDGMVQMLDVTLDIALRISDRGKLPKYNKKDEFAKAQPER
ncbi:MAG: M28 family peptidase [Aridibacter famidurans]|nr:M28 family peptidase [Aridibacter famidurans]